MRTFLTSAAAILAIGCGDPGGGPSGGADASVTCRAPAGCFALSISPGDPEPWCNYVCEGGARTCIPLPDGGVRSSTGGIPLAELSGTPYAVHPQSDRLNCGDCGNRCPDERRYCVRGLCSPTL